VLALAASQALAAADAVLARLSQPHFAQLTVGFRLACSPSSHWCSSRSRSAGRNNRPSTGRYLPHSAELAAAPRKTSAPRRPVRQDWIVLTGREPWVLDELAYAGRENLDAAHVARYDRKEDADPAGEVAALLASGLVADATVVDLGAGTGQFTLAVAPNVRRVVAVDVSPVMLDHLRAKLANASVDNVECVQAGFLTYDHAGAPADVVYSRYALHHLPDFWKALALTRIASMLRPGGILRLADVVYGFDAPDAAAGLEQWMAGATSASIDTDWTRAELEEHVRDEHSTFTWLLEPMISRAGLVIERADYSADRMVARYTCVKPARSTRDRTPAS